jgi:hypothetical protein
MHYSFAALSLARATLLAPGYLIELGFFFVILIISLVPSWRGRALLTPAERSLVFIVVCTLVFVSFLRSSVLKSDDFGLRAPLIAQFGLLLLSLQLMPRWKSDKHHEPTAGSTRVMHQTIPSWLRSAAALMLIIGMIGTFYEALLLRFYTPLAGISARSIKSPDYSPFHNAFISTIGYAKLDKAIPSDAVVQFNPHFVNHLVTDIDLREVDHQIVIASDQPWCGAELGGDPSGCLVMAAALDNLYHGASSDQARITCRQFGIQYLIARLNDQAWNDKSGWVWGMDAVVADDEFRAVNCRE